MKQSFREKLYLCFRNMEERILKWIIRWCVKKLDSVKVVAFLAYSWGVDDVTDYHLIAERSYSDHHIFGTRCEFFDKVTE